MEARVKHTWPFRTLQGLAGREFCKDEWRPVLPGFEEEATKHPYLEVREETVSVETVEPEEAKFVAAVVKPTPKPHTTISKGKAGKK